MAFSFVSPSIFHLSTALGPLLGEMLLGVVLLRCLEVSGESLGFEKALPVEALRVCSCGIENHIHSRPEAL